MSAGSEPTTAAPGRLAELLASHYERDSTGQWSLDSPRFYQAWFRGPDSQPYFFLFKKNLAVTNLQFAELLALLRTYTKVDGQQVDPTHLQFLSTDEFNRKVEELLAALGGEEDDGMARCERFERNWGDLFGRTVVIDAFYGSCVVFFPPGLDVDLKTVCGVSGYIHSCGPSVWARKVRKAEPHELIEKLLPRVDPEGLKVMFAVYSHEDFTEYDREEASELRDGLDDVKIWVDKFWVKRERLVSVLNRLSEEIPTLEVAGAGDYRAVHARLSKREDVDKDRCFWLVVDREVTADGQHRGQERFYHCYEQHYYNASPFHMFEENKPAWRAHTTLPHTLTGAMINLTRPYWPPKEQLRLIDPFVGTGTTLLEAAKFPKLRAEGIDLDPIVPLLVEDNLRFFTSSASSLESLGVYLAQVIAIQAKREGKVVTDATALLGEKRIREVIDAYQRADLAVASINEADDELTMDAEQVRALAEEWTFEERLLFYIGLRAVRRNVGARERQDERALYSDAWLSEAKLLMNQIEHLKERYAAETLEEASSLPLRIFRGSYSKSCSIPHELLRELAARDDLVRRGDALELSGDDSAFDLFVTDPPYGFNTDADPTELAELYKAIIGRALMSLDAGGQMVLALPDQSFIGRDPAFFANRSFIEQQVAAMAHDLGRELVVGAEVVPSSPPIYRAPYYWESERALRRSILHYRIGARPAERPDAELAEAGPASD